jgi:esterase/lipase superfamily enzyme
MQEKTGGAIAAGAVVVAIAYATAAFRPEAPPSAAAAPEQVSAALDTTAAGASTGQLPYESVTVFYATDRAIARPGHAERALEIGIAAIAAILGLIAFSAWFAQRGQKKLAASVGGLALVAAAAFAMWLPGKLPKPGISGAHHGGLSYGTGRGEMQLGYCEVSIPLSHGEGELESPSILRLELSARPDRHVMLQEIVPQESQDFYDAVRQRVQAAPQHDLFVFVHGFNVSFEKAARRTAQIAHDLDYDGVPVFFSWPSQGKAWRYTVDETNVTWSVPHLKSFLTDLAERTDAQAINLIAHSMGNRALTQTICELGYECQQDRKLFQQVILAAPDIDADVFRDQIAPALARYSSHVTLYVSANDEALAASKLVHGSMRAGESASQPVAVAGVETIDVATTDLGPLGHSYYGSCPLILQDLAAILIESRSASHREWLAPVNTRGAMYWRLSDVPAMAASPAQTTRQN